MGRIIDFLAAEEAATTMSVEQWFAIYGVAILKREEAKRGLKAMGKAAGAGR
jgi:hypothetical protein